MKCNACKYEFCWLCLAKYTNDHYNYTQATPCSGRMFTDKNNNRRPNICCFILVGLLIYLLLPVIVLLIFLFILPIRAVLSEYGEIRKRTVRINGLEPGNNRYAGRDFKAAIKTLGCCKLFGYSLLSILIFPFTLILIIIPFVIFLLIWIFFLFVIIYKNIRYLCCPANNRNVNRNPNPPVYA